MVPLTWRLRLVALALLGAVAVFALVSRLWDLQWAEGAVFRERARENTILAEPLPPPRGRILDCLGKVMAGNEPRYAVTVTPVEVRDLQKTVRVLSTVLTLRPMHVLHVIQRHKKLDPLDPVVVARALSPEAVARVATVQRGLPGVRLAIRPQRRYPFASVASHVLGYVGEITAEEYQQWKKAGYHPSDVVGHSGLEQSYDRWLKGRAGAQNVAVDAMGHTVQVEETVPPVPGDDLHLSLDMDLQIHAEQALQATLDHLYQQNGERTAGGVVFMEVRTGRILALASRPDFDPRLFARGISDKQYEALLKNPLHPLLSRAYQVAYPPGSTFKPLNASACLQSGICSPDTVFYCSGEYKGFHCFVRSGHGRIDFTEAIAQSCDATFYMLGDRLGIKRMDRFAHAFGLGHRTGLDLPDEQDGLFGTPKWKKKIYGEDWQYYDTINMAIGQGLMMVSPLQQAVVISAIANGGYVVKPHLVDWVESWNHQVKWRYHPRALRRVPVKPKWLMAVRKGMEGVVDHGTGVAAKSDLISIAGKTGTAEAVPTVDNPKGRNHTWFVSYAPIDKPKIVCVVFVAKAGGYGGGVAAPIAKDCIEYWYREHHPGAVPPPKEPAAGVVR
ncbi:MAG TPA: penicillin-binding protein 2 [Candidatus Xenobia bacterium]|jgi:penicillin-binding protein 2